MKKVIIRTDASAEIGSGHVMRCLTIAKNLQKHHIIVKFWMIDLPGNLIEYVRQEGFETINQAEMADLYIIDNYDIEKKWEQSIRLYTNRVMVIDDLANREHDCDLLLDQNVVPHYETRYENLIPSKSKKLLGPKYLILRDEFTEARQNLKIPHEKIEQLLIFMGGSDPTGETLKIINALEKTNATFKRIDIVVGNGNTQKFEIECICNERGYQFHCQINYLSKLMQQADFSIGAGGSTAWERCYVGLPSSCTIVAENQYVSTEYTAYLGAVWNLGWHEQVRVKTYVELLNSLQTSIDKLQIIRQVGLTLTESNRPNAWLDEILELLS